MNSQAIIRNWTLKRGLFGYGEKVDLSTDFSLFDKLDLQSDTWDLHLL